MLELLQDKETADGQPITTEDWVRITNVQKEFHRLEQEVKKANFSASTSDLRGKRKIRPENVTCCFTFVRGQESWLLSLANYATMAKLWGTQKYNQTRKRGQKFQFRLHSTEELTRSRNSGENLFIQTSLMERKWRLPLSPSSRAILKFDQYWTVRCTAKTTSPAAT